MSLVETSDILASSFTLHGVWIVFAHQVTDVS